MFLLSVECIRLWLFSFTGFGARRPQDMMGKKYFGKIANVKAELRGQNYTRSNLDNSKQRGGGGVWWCADWSPDRFSCLTKGETNTKSSWADRSCQKAVRMASQKREWVIRCGLVVG